MPRFFIDQSIASDQNRLVLSDSDAHHLFSVLRVARGEQVSVIDQTHTHFVCEVDEETFRDQSGQSLRILHRFQGHNEPPQQWVLYQCLPKGDKFSEIIRHCVELGVSRVVPVSSDHSVVHLNAQKAQQKKARWQAVALSAAKQAGRDCIPEIDDLKDIQTIIAMWQTLQREEGHFCFVPYEAAQNADLRNHLETFCASLDGQKPVSLHFIIGPEGGFSAQEVAAFQKAQIPLVGLGPRILRTETAGMAVLSMLSYAFEMD